MSTPGGPTNYHTHCYLCDGAGNPVEYAEVARARGFSSLGFSSHAPLPFHVDWVMRRESLPEYQREIDIAKSHVKNAVEVFTGLEIDYVPDSMGPEARAFPEIDLDFIIGSVHFVQSQTGEQLPIDGSLDEFTDTVERGMNGDIRALVSGYYANMREMLTAYSPDILGHPDVIRKNNSGRRFFDTSDSWYRNEVTATIEAVAQNGCIVEINTGALARGRDALYPESWVVEALREKNVRMMVNTDAHAPAQLGHGYDRAFSVLKHAGFSEQWVLTEGVWRSVPIPG